MCTKNENRISKSVGCSKNSGKSEIYIRRILENKKM